MVVVFGGDLRAEGRIALGRLAGSVIMLRVRHAVYRDTANLLFDAPARLWLLVPVIGHGVLNQIRTTLNPGLQHLMSMHLVPGS